MPTTVEVQQISKSFNGQQAVNNLAFSIPSGKIFGLLGPNGAGKTTTIRMLMNIIIPDSGRVMLFGQPFERGALRRIGYLPEERGLYKKMNTVDMLVFLAELRGMNRAVALETVRRWMHRLEMDDWEKKKVEELSKGMQQKLQFAGTVLHDPDLIILDEPFTGLDPVNANLLKKVMLELEEKGKTIVFSTHQMEQVERLCDGICLVNKGQTVLQGSLREIKRGFGSNTIMAGVEGDWSFLNGTPGVRDVTDTGNFIRVKMEPHADPQTILAAMIPRLRVTHFELTEPSLEEIFIQSVGKVAA